MLNYKKNYFKLIYESHNENIFMIFVYYINCTSNVINI